MERKNWCGFWGMVGYGRNLYCLAIPLIAPRVFCFIVRGMCMACRDSIVAPSYLRLVLLLWLSLYTNWCTTQQLRWDGDAIDCVCCLIWNSVDSDSVGILIVCCTCISTTDVNIDNQMRQHYNTNDVYSPREDEVYLQRKEGIPGSPRWAYVCVLGREANIQIFEQSWYICWFRWIGGLHCNVSHIIRILRMCRVQTHVENVRRGTRWIKQGSYRKGRMEQQNQWVWWT